MNKLCLSGLLLLSSCAIASAKQTLIVFDASGSMWGQIEGEAKITLARNAMADISLQFKNDEAVGLLAYGHRKKGDCDDIELLVPVAKNNAQSLVEKVNQINPKGKTPIGRSLQMATEYLKISEQAAEVVLISDGLETCDLDPCLIAEQAEALGIDFTAHVIGFGITNDMGKQLSCVADITGGQYLAAEDAASLESALQQVLSPPKVEPIADILPEAHVSAPEQVPAIGTSFAVNWSGPNEQSDYLDIVKLDHDKAYGELSYAWTQNGQPAEIKAPGNPGKYQLRYIWQGKNKKHVLAKTTFEVKDSDVSLIAPHNVAAGEGFNVSWTGPNQPGDYIDLVRKGNTKAYGELNHFYTKVGQTGQLLAPADAGEYNIRYILEAADGRKILHTIPLQVSSVEVTLSAPPEVEIGQKFDVFWTGPNNKDGYIDLVKRNEVRTYGEFSYFYLKDHAESGEITAHIIAGEYDIRFIMVGSDGRQIMTTQPITILPVAATLEAPTKAAAESQISVKWQGPNRSGDYIDLVKHNNHKTYGELSYFYTESNPVSGQLTMPKQPGTYTIRYIIQGKMREVLATHDVVVE